MKLDETTIDAAANRIARRWKVRVLAPVAETHRAYVFKVERDNGLAALKIYKRLGSGGEGSGVYFLRDLPPGIGVQVYRSSMLRSAVLMEWLEGDTLDRLIIDGQETRAVTLTAQIANAVYATKFRLPAVYQRVALRMRRDLISLAKSSPSKSKHPEMQRVKTLLDHLIKTTTNEHVIHGDLIFSNIMLTQEGPRLIDPKGLRCDTAFEMAKTLISPYSTISAASLPERIAIRGPVLAKAVKSSTQRLTQWAAVILGHTIINGKSRDSIENSKDPYLTKLLDLSGE